MKSLRLLLSAVVAVLALLPAQARHVNHDESRNQYRPYPDTDLPALTPAPEGYAPFHIEHYGRHGSRWLITPDNYGVPVAELSKAERNGVLTAEGARLLAELRRIQADSKGRLGELTPLGAQQHRGIAARMGRNFPEVFVPGATVDARSTVVIRCILSMLNATGQLRSDFPGVVVKTDASEADMYYMNRHDPVKNAAVDSASRLFLDPYRERHFNKGDYLTKLISDPKFIADSIDTRRLFLELIDVAQNVGSHGDAYEPILPIFSDEEIDEAWRINNASWYVKGAASPLTSFKAAEAQHELLRNMIASADTAIVAERPSANLRFGHETMVLSLASLMGLDNWGVALTGLEQVEEEWPGYDLFPMAANLQMVFYRRPGSRCADDVLVKILLNEHETAVEGLNPVVGPYYNWSQLREKFL